MNLHLTIFLKKKIRFLDITKTIKNTLINYNAKNPSNINDIFDVTIYDSNTVQYIPVV